MIEVHLLRYALAAADSGSFSRAADQFGIKQSTLSKRVQYLEDRLGLPLFRRSTRGVVPTDPGERFLRRARHIVEDIALLDRESRALARGETGVLRLGFHGSLAGGDLSAALAAYRTACPDVEIEASEGNRDHLLNALDKGRLDLAILAGRSDQLGIRSLCWWSEPLLLALPLSHPLAETEPLYWTDLRGAAFVVTAGDPGPDIGAMITARLSGPGYRPRIVTQNVSRDNLPSFAGLDRIAALVGVPPIPPFGTESPILRAVHDAFGATSLDQAIHWRGDNDSPALMCFLDLLSRRYARPIPSS